MFLRIKILLLYKLSWIQQWYTNSYLSNYTQKKNLLICCPLSIIYSMHHPISPPITWMINKYLHRYINQLANLYYLNQSISNNYFKSLSINRKAQKRQNSKNKMISIKMKRLISNKGMNGMARCKKNKVMAKLTNNRMNKEVMNMQMKDNRWTTKNKTKMNKWMMNRHTMMSKMLIFMANS